MGTLRARAGIFNIIIEQGADLRPVLTWKDTTETPVDLTGFTARMQIREKVESEDVLFELTTTNGRIVLEPFNPGEIQLIFDDILSSAWNWTDGVYHLEMIDSLGSVRRLLKGTVYVDPEITR